MGRSVSGGNTQTTRSRAERAGAAIITVGDPQQLPAVGAGGMYEALLEHGEIDGRILGQVWRMHAAWEREASLQIRAGDPTALDTYVDQERIIAGDGLATVFDSFAGGGPNGEEVLITAYTNRQRGPAQRRDAGQTVPRP